MEAIERWVRIDKGRSRSSNPNYFISIIYFEGGVLVTSGEAAGGQGVPEGVVPGVPGVPELPCLLAEGEGEVEDDEPGLEDPVLGVELPGMPGKGPQGEPLGVVELGSIGDGWVLVPGVGVFGEAEPGTGVGGGVVGIAGLLGGVTGVPAGVAVLAGGVAVLPGGVAVLPGGVAVPGV